MNLISNLNDRINYKNYSVEDLLKKVFDTD